MMGSLDLATIASSLGAQYSGPTLLPLGASIDSRRVAEGDLFFALPGEHVDGHDYVDAAASAGAIAAVVDHPVDTALPCLEVKDVAQALAILGKTNREAFHGRLVAITGSCGKTSVKNLCDSIFSDQGSTVATLGNYNNELGVPLTLARLSDETQFAVIEMGAKHRGDVAYLCELAQPEVTVVLNAMEAHIEGFGSVAGVADIKAEIYDGLSAAGVAVLNLDEQWAELWQQRIQSAGARLLTFSLEREAHVRASDIRPLGLGGSEFLLHIEDDVREVHLPLPGRHNVANALAAAALAYGAGLTLDVIARGLEAAKGEPGRLQSERLANGTVLVDDTYNANPGSVRAAIDLLAETAGQRMLILGEMLELGENAERWHAEMGERAREKGIEGFVGVGDALQPAVSAFGEDSRWYPSQQELASDGQLLLDMADTILVKGSRGAAMERTLQSLRSAAEGEA